MDANTISYFDTLYNKCGDMIVCIWSEQGKTFVNSSKLAETLEGIISARQTNWFHSYQPLRHVPSKGRGTSADVGAIVGAYLDVDVGSGEGSKYAGVKNPELTPAELKALFVAWGYPTPSAIVHTGNGFHFEWRLDQPFVLTGPKERMRAVAFLKAFNQRAVRLGKESGLKLDSMPDLARVKRVAGSMNVKDPGNPKAVKLVELDSAVTYSLEQLEAVEPPAVSQSAVRKAAQPQGGFDDHKRPNWQGVVAGCAFARHVEASTELTEPEWHSAASLIGRCEGGDVLFHTLSARDDRYDPVEAATKLERATTETKPHSCAHIHEGAPAFDGCKGCPFFGRLPSPIGLGFERPEVSKLISEYILDNETGRYFAWQDLSAVPRDAFIRAKRHLKLGNAANAFEESKRAVIAQRVDYRPGGPKLLPANGHTVLNTWSPSGVEAVEGDCSTILAHFEYLFPDKGQRDHLLNYYAHLIQFPAVKIAHAVLIMGRRQGTGKSMAVAPLKAILGSQNVAAVSNQMVKTPWTANYSDVQLAVVEELMGNDRLSVYNDLKEWITEETASANQKNLVVRTARTPRGWIFITNHPDPLLLDRGDRRLFVLETEAEPQDKDYYDRLGVALAAELPAFCHWLSVRDLNAFNPKAQPPMTAAKERMQELATPPIERLLREAWEAGNHAFARDVGTLADVKLALLLSDSTVGPLRDSDVQKALGAVGARKLGQVRIGPTVVNLWVWRNPERWAKATPAELRAAYVEPLAPVLAAVG